MAETNPFEALAQIVSLGRDYVPDGGSESRIKAALDALFDTRYHSRSRPTGAYRDAYALAQGDGVPYAGVIAPDNSPSGAYGGASFAWFPCDDGTLVTFVVGTKGLVPDEGLLTRHGHRRRVTALRHHLARLGVATWAKADPAAISISIPQQVKQQFASCADVFKRYGDVVYAAAWIPKGNSDIARVVLQAYIDLYAFERGWQVRAAMQSQVDDLVAALHNHALPRTTMDEVNSLLRERRFVVLQGPPGTGKTRMAERVKSERFAGSGRTIQFHPAVTYEDFIVGLSPDPTETGLRFRAKPGWLLEAAEAAAHCPYLLIVDEINRGDLGKVLGEAIYLFEPGEVGGQNARTVHLTHAVQGSTTFRLPPNLYVLGTMNTADRSIAGLDLAVRRRFAFMTLMPDRSAIGLDPARVLFEALVSVFIEHASDEMLNLLPGHSYFLATSELEFKNRLRYELIPLLDEYLRQGLLGQATMELYAVRDRMVDYSLAS